MANEFKVKNGIKFPDNTVQTTADNSLIASGSWQYTEQGPNAGTFRTNISNKVVTLSQAETLLIHATDSSSSSIYTPVDNAIDNNQQIYIELDNGTNSIEYMVQSTQKSLSYDYRGYTTYFNKISGDDPNITQLFIFKGGSAYIELTDNEVGADSFYINLDSVSNFSYFSLFCQDSIRSISNTTISSFIRRLIDKVYFDDSNNEVTDIATLKTRFYSNYSYIVEELLGLYPEFQFNNSPRVSVSDLTGGSGADAIISVLTDIGPWSNPIITDAGTGYTVNDVLTSATYTTLTVTVTSIGAGGTITGVSVSGDATTYFQWPTDSINDGGDDQYDGGNKIYTDLEKSTALPYSSGNLVTGTTAETYFGSGASYACVYKKSVFGLFVASPSYITKFIIEGNLGADGNGLSEPGQLGYVDYYRFFVKPLSSSAINFTELQNFNIKFFAKNFFVDGLLFTNTDRFYSNTGAAKITTLRDTNLIVESRGDLNLIGKDAVRLEGGSGSIYNKSGRSASVIGGDGIEYNDTYRTDLAGQGGSVTVAPGTGTTIPAIAITSISKSSPAKVVLDGDIVTIAGYTRLMFLFDNLDGMSELNNNRFYAEYSFDENGFLLYHDSSSNLPVDSTNYTTFVSGQVVPQALNGTLTLGLQPDRDVVNINGSDISALSDGHIYIDSQYATTITGLYSLVLQSNNPIDLGNDANVSGTLSANVLQSLVSTGTAPLTVASTTAVANLNADLLDGKHGPTGNIVGDTDTQNLSNKTFVDNPTFSAGTANAVIFLNGSKVSTTSGNLVFNGTSLGIGTPTPSFTSGTGLHIFRSGAAGPAALRLQDSSTDIELVTSGGNAIFGNRSNGGFFLATGTSPTTFFYGLADGRVYLPTIAPGSSSPLFISSGEITSSGTVPVNKGGTNATTATAARTNLDVPSRSGANATGTWSISITGSAANAANLTGTTTDAIVSSALATGTADSTTYLRGDRTWASISTSSFTSDFVANVVPGAGISVTGATQQNAIKTVSLLSSGVSAGTYGNSTLIPSITVDEYGRVTAAANVAVEGGSGGITTGKAYAMAILFG